MATKKGSTTFDEAVDVVVSENGHHAQDDVFEFETFSFERPPRANDVPPPRSKAVRRITTPDGSTWFDVRGGGTQVEGRFITWSNNQLNKAIGMRDASSSADLAVDRARAAINARRLAGLEVDAELTRVYDEARERRAKVPEFSDENLRQAEILYNSRMATFIADRVVDHNMVNDDGDKLGVGLDLFWEMSATDALRLVARIQNKDSVWSDPKPDEASSTG